MSEPVVTKLPPPPACVYCRDVDDTAVCLRHRADRKATYDVDGTAVCLRHRAEAIVLARAKRAQQ